jgi:hypothetical protein
MLKEVYTSPIGLSVSKGSWEGAEWTITGFPRKELTVVAFESAYDFEELISEKVNCKGITFDSEFSQFFAYAKTKARAVSFAKAIEKHFEKVRKLVGISK